MALIIADRVKETTITQGTGTITLSGSTFGGFQSFSDAIGEGNSTYYCIQNESNFEIGIGTFSSGSLSRDTVLESSNSDAKISIVGTAVVFCVIPSQKLIFKDENDNVTLPQDLTIDDLSVDYISAASGDFSGPLTSNSFSSSLVSANDIIATDSLNSSGLLTLRRESAGNFFHAYIDDSNDRTISLYSDGLTPTWSLGLKSSPSSETEAPSYGYIYASDGEFGIVGNMNNKVTMSNATPFCVQHQGQNIIQAHYLTGVHLDSMTSAFPALVVNGGISLSANIQEWDTYDGTTLSVVDNQGFFGIRNDNPSYQLDVTGTGSFSQAVRFGDGTLQTTAGIPYASGSLIDQNAANLISQSGYFQSHVDIRDAAISGNLQSQIDQNISDISATSGYFESRVDAADATAISHSGYFESRVDQLDSDVSYVSGVAVYGSGHNLQTVSDNGASTTNALTITNNNITASSGLFDSLDMTPLAEANYPAHQEGVVFYDVDNHTLSLYNDEADVTLQLGQEEFLRVRNNTGATITNGTAVLITGSHGNAAPTVSGAIATSESFSQIVGLTTHDIEDNSFGYVTTYGIVRNIDTSQHSDGDEIFLSATQIGSGVNVPPTIPNYKVTIGHVIRSHASNGSILVQVGHPKLGGGDLKSEAELNLSGVPFVTTKSDLTAGGSQTDPLFIFDSGNRQLQLGSGLQLLDGQPSNTTNVLYNDGGDLYFNGSEIGVSGESLDFAGNVLTYNNSKGGSFTADLSSLSTFDTSGVSLAYSAGTLTYTNNAGGSFDVDLSSISGDVYAMIVDGAPATLDTLNEIAAALNDDENIANTLTSLISTTSGNLQSQITGNDNDISQLNNNITSVSGYFESRSNSTDSDVATVSGLLSTAGDRFTSDITVSLGGGKTFGRYENGDTIPSSGLKPSQVISLAVTEPIAPTASLTSSSTVDFNQVNVSTTLNFSHTINSLGATVTSASLEFRRGNSGSWTVLSTSTSASSSYNHTFTDTAFNTAVLNYRYTVTDTAGATITVTKNINPDTYSAPTISFSVAAVSTTSPESNSSRERGNVNSNISGSINRNETYVNLISYTLQYSVNGGAWTDVGSAVSIGPGNSTISTTNHNPTSNNTATSIRYRVEVVDDYTTSYSSISTVSFGFLIFYGSSSSSPTTSTNVRALPSRLFTTGNNTFTLNTGSTEVNFTVAIPSTETISEVIDLDALNANITSQYVNNPFNVDDAGGTAVSYNVYTMTQATAYSSNHRHQVTKG